MADEKKCTEEKHYAVLTRESVKVYGEAGGHSDISDTVAGMLGEDVSYRLRAIAQVGAQFMRHARRRRLTTEDINKALKNMDVQPVFGHGSLDPQPFQQTREGEIHFVEDLEVNFVNIATNSFVPKYQGNTSIKSHWLALEGVQKTSSSQQAQQSQNPSQPGKLPAKPGAKFVTEELLMYYDHITKAILGCDEELTKVALEDLRTNSKIVPLLPYFVNFVSNGVKTISYDITQLTKLLHTVKALTNNPHLYLEPKPYLTLLVQAVMYCILEPLAASINPLNDHWVLRDYAARLLAQIIHGWKTPVNQLFHNALRSLKDALHDLAKPSCSHYGAVMGLLSLGCQAVEDIIIPHLPNYWPHLQNIIEDSSVANALAKADAHKVHGALLLAVEFLIKKKLRDFQAECSKVPATPPSTDELTLPKEKVSVKQERGSQMRKDLKSSREKVCAFYANMYEYFGDSLAMRLPKLNLQHIFKPSRKETLISLRDKDLDGKTGEDLLQDFMEQVRIQQIKEAEERKKREEIERQMAIERRKLLQRQEKQRLEKELRRKLEVRRRQDELWRQQQEERWRYQEQERHLAEQDPDEVTHQYVIQPSSHTSSMPNKEYLENYDGSDVEEEPDHELDEMSDHSPESERSEDKSEEDGDYFSEDHSQMALKVKSTVSDPTIGVKLTLKVDRSDKGEKYKDKDYKHGKKRKQSQRSPRESSRSPWDSERYEGAAVKRKADMVYQFDSSDYTGKQKSSTNKRLSQREATDPCNYELVNDERTQPREKLRLILSKSKLKGSSSNQDSPNYS